MSRWRPAVVAAIAAASVTWTLAARAPGATDADGDGVDDAQEDALAEQFAPVVHHSRSETNYPVSVEWLLARTSLRAFDDRAAEGREVLRPVASQAALVSRSSDGEAGGARSTCKRSGFFLADVDTADREGQKNDPRGWVTYVHAYRNDTGGVTIQYWRLYAYDESRVLFFDWGHGGDWEGIAVHLDATLKPESIGLLGHMGIERIPAREMTWEGTHPLVWSEPGGHASRKTPDSSGGFARQETWTGGRVTWWDSRRGGSGGLINVGEKSRPRGGQVFIQYAGLWGSPHRTFLTSGYWGPAFNETGAICDDGRAAYRMSIACGARAGCAITHVAWCDRMSGPLDRARECRAAQSAP